MNVVAIMGGYRKGRTVDTLLDRALAGVLEVQPGASIDRITLIDRHIEYCRNCMTCRNDDPSRAFAACVIRDDMQALYPLLDRADAYIFATPIEIGRESAVFKTFAERICWVLARPGRRPLKGCPEPRTARRKRAVAILSSGIVPPLLRRFCDDATPLIRDLCRSVLNARLVGSLYAGAVERRSVESYTEKAFRLGRKLAAE